jgi:hypothetical protein
MATTRGMNTTAARREAQTGVPVGGLRFDWLMTVAALLLIGGVYLDGWAHNHLAAELESFFTPWHGVMYTGVALNLLIIGGLHVRNMLRGYAWGRTVPAGYHLTLIGVGLFALMGVADMVWHTVFGIELGADASLSPPHMLIFVALLLISGGPLRAAWARRESLTWANALPLAISIGLTLSSLTVITQLASPFTHPYAGVSYGVRNEMYILLGVLSVALQTALLMAVVLLVARRWGAALPFGVFTLAMLLNGTLMSLQTYEFRFLPAMLIGGLAADALLRWVRREGGAGNLWYALLVPVILYSAYFVIILLTDRIWWRVHGVTGAIAIAGGVGIALAVLIWPPKVESD